MMNLAVVSLSLFSSISTLGFSPLPSLPVSLRPSRSKSFASTFGSDGASKRPGSSSNSQWENFSNLHLGVSAGQPVPPKVTYSGVTTHYGYLGDVVSSSPTEIVYSRSSTSSVSASLRVFGDDKGGGTNDGSYSNRSPIGVFDLPTFSSTRLPCRFLSSSSITGPTLLRSSSLSTELSLSYSTSRLRCAFVHKPAWEKGKERGGNQPDCLKLSRATVTFEDREVSVSPPPAAEINAIASTSHDDDDDGDDSSSGYDSVVCSRFYRPTPPFQWSGSFRGSSSTWGSRSGHSRWSIPALDEADAWHCRPTGDGGNVWSVRLGCVLIMCPKLVVPRAISGAEGGAGSISALDKVFRCAWMPGENEILRVEGAVGGDYCNQLTAHRCDVLERIL